MHEYDVAFKLVFQDVDVTIRELIGTTVARWLNVELPEVRNTRVDLLGETANGDLVHIELQSTNERHMAVRMLEYRLRVFRVCGRFPRQVLLYVGDPPLTMEAELSVPALKYSFQLIDIRELDGARLLQSEHLGDNIVAVLTGLPDARAAVHRVLGRIEELPPGDREVAFRRLFILTGLRDRLGQIVEEEAEKMPILNDILDHPIIGRERKKGELIIIRRLIQERFGSVPDWAEERLSELSHKELEDLSVRVQKVNTVEELFD